MPHEATPLQGQLIEQAALLHREGQLPDAERIYRTVLSADPDHFAALYYLGLICAQRGQVEAAIPMFRAALKQNSKVPEVHNNLGMALYSLHRYADAVACYENAVVLNPRYAVACNNLGTALGAMGRHEDAILRFERALAIRPDYVEVLNNLGTEYFALGSYDRAIDYFQKAVAARPDFADAQLNLGNAFLARERPHDALESYQRAATLRPRSVPIRLLIGDLLKALHRPEEAIQCYEQALLEEPRSVETLIKLGNVLQTINGHEEAMAAYRRVLTVDPGNAEAYDCLGFALAELGDAARARQAFEAALRIEPNRTKSYFGLVNSTKITHDDPILAAMTGLAVAEDSLTASERARLHFALGKALADVGKHGRSFAHLVEGNALRRREIAYDEAGTLGRFERVQTIFTQDLMLRNGGGNPSRKPIFILGMMRTGSTLVEQILASHPRVFAAGERLDFQETVIEVMGKGGDASGLPEFASELSPRVLSRIGSAYLDRLDAAERAARTGGAKNGSRTEPADRVTDKLPANFLLVGLICLVFPNAAIIHTCRDPIDTCLSCFSNLFVENQPQTYELGELGRYYRGYAALMAYWRKILQPGAMLEVQYETLIDDFEAEARRIIDYCGLDWQDACLEFYRARRPVRTASMAQVRQPIYRTSVGRPRPDDATLRPLLNALGLQNL